MNKSGFVGRLDTTNISTLTAHKSFFNNKGHLQSDIEDVRYYLGLFSDDEENESQYAGSKHHTRYDERRRVSLRDRAKSFYYFRPPYTDGSFGSISEQASIHMVQSVLPFGLRGVHVEASLTRGGETRRDEGISNALTEELREVIKRPRSNFLTGVLDAVRDYVLYGTCILTYEPRADGSLFVQHYPFHLTCFDTPAGSSTPAWLFSQTRTRSLEGEEQISMLFVQAIGGQWLKTTTIRSTATQEPEVLAQELDFDSIFIAREGKYSSTTYGRGSGIIALPHVVFLNWCADESFTNTEKTNAPATVHLSDIALRSKTYGANSIDLAPKASMTYSIKEELLAGFGGNYDPLRMLTPNPIAKQELQSDALYAREQIKAVFGIDSYLASQPQAGSTSPRTAAEINYRQDQNSSLYNVKAQTLQRDLIEPLLTKIFNTAVLPFNRAAQDYDTKIVLTTSQDISLKDMQLTRMERYMATIAQLDPSKLDEEDYGAYKIASLEKLV